MHTIIVGVPAAVQTCGFERTKFAINAKELIDDIPIEHHAVEVYEFVSMFDGKTLGLKWNILKETFLFFIRDPPDRQITTRTILSFVASIFDLLGLFTPWVLLGKVLLQDATRMKFDCDIVVPHDICLQGQLAR